MINLRFLMSLFLISLVNITYSQVSQVLYTFDRPTDAFYMSNITFSEDGSKLAFGTREGSVKIYDLATGKLYHEFKDHKGIAIWVDFSQNDSLLASGGKDGIVNIYNVRNKTKVKSIKAHDKAINNLCFAAGDFQLLTGSRDNTIKIWNVASGTLIKQISDIKGNVRTVIFSPDGKSIIAATSALSKGLRIYDWQTEKEIRAVEAPNTISIALNPDESILSSASLHNEVYLWNAQSTTILDSLKGHSDFVKSIDFSPGGRFLISGSDDKSIKLWDVKEKKLLYTFNGHTNIVNTVSYSKNGKKIASGSWDGTIKVWDLTSLNLPKEDIYIIPDNKDLPKEDAEILLTTFKNLQFEIDKAVIKPESYASLDALAKLMIKKPTYKLAISGHTDNTGDATYNYKLSIQRSEAVKNYLIAKKIDKNRITASGYGATIPIADNSTEQGRKLNRRVEFNLLIK